MAITTPFVQHQNLLLISRTEEFAQKEHNIKDKCHLCVKRHLHFNLGIQNNWFENKCISLGIVNCL